MKYSIFKQTISDGIRAFRMSYFTTRRDRFGYIAPSAKIYPPFYGTKENIFMYDNTKIGEDSSILAHKGKFVMKANSRSGMRLTVICQNHSTYNKVGCYPGDEEWWKEQTADVIIDEEVWIGHNVTICPGVHIPRGCFIAAGSVCVRSKSVPPYSIIGGNPARFIKFKFTIEEQIEHEKIRYPESERLDESLLMDNYIKFRK